MRFILLFLLSISFINCIAQADALTNFKKLEWLIGKWDRTNITTVGKTGYEVWNKSGDQELRGHGGVLQGQDTLITEDFSIVIKDNTIYYVAVVPENNKPIYFKMTTINSSGFVCENPEHDYPKKITYQLTGKNLKAQISGNGKSSNFFFTRSK
jgi:hypothetical protein